jgi:choline dehydrogenase-like flavoprotein
MSRSSVLNRRVRIIDANDLEAGSTITADICVVGSGAAGLTIATELDGTDQTVCLVESGAYGPDEQTQALYDLESIGHPVRQNFMSRARYFGGTSNLWAGRTMRLAPLDFDAREWVPESGWPIPYEEVSRHYPAADRILNLPAHASVEAVVEASRVHPTESCFVGNADLAPTAAVWGRSPVRFGNACRRRLQSSRNISTYLNASVIEIALNGAGNRVDTCLATTLGRKTIRFEARRFVLACGGLETARLLLASRSVHPDGVGNEHDVVGRYYMDHPRAVFGRVKLTRPTRLHGLLGVALPDGMAQVGIRLRDELQERERLLNSYLTLERHWSEAAAGAYQSFVHSAKILLKAGYAGKRVSFSGARLAKVPELIYLLAPRELLPHPLYRLARQIKERFSAGVTDLVVVNYSEQLPNPQSRVTLGSERDRFGMPRLVLNWIISRQEIDTLMRMHELLDAHLRRNNLGRLEHSPASVGELTFTDASHHLGTTRMSTNRRTGVVDEHCRVHGVSNLFIAGSGVFPTAGHANPTLTIIALAVRLAAHLKDQPGPDR